MRLATTITLIGVVVFVYSLGYYVGAHASAAYRMGAAARMEQAVARKGTGTAVARSAHNDLTRTDVTGKDTLSSDQREAAREEELAELAMHDPDRALALALREPNWRLRRALRNSVLRGWASVAPIGAARFALALPPHERTEAFAAVFQGATNDPGKAVEAGTLACTQDPSLAEEYGRNLIRSLATVDAYPQLLEFAKSDTTGHTADWFNATFYQWASRNPASARDALVGISDAPAREAAFQGLVLGWAIADPTDLARYASSLPPGENRTLALQQALASWTLANPEGAAAWMACFDPSTDFDLGAATIALRPEFALYQPALALGWAQSIMEPTLRASTLTMLGQQLGSRDRTAAEQFLHCLPGLSAEDRAYLIDGIASAAGAN